jgi:endogenous inhibitor of DNA gyrase (YacG/DUF329 family)
MPVTVKCPTCGKSVAWTETEKFKPFCSERCKLIDLGAWATESYAIPGKPSLAEEGEADRDGTGEDASY